MNVVEAVLPAVKATAAASTARATEASTDGEWELQPSESDATLSVPPSMRDDTDSTIGRLCYLGPKLWLLCYVHCSSLSSGGIALAKMAASSSVSPLGILALIFPAWCTLFLAAGVLEAVARRYVWLRRSLVERARQ